MHPIDAVHRIDKCRERSRDAVDTDEMNTLDQWMTSEEHDVRALKERLMPGESRLKFSVCYRPALRAYEIEAREPEYADEEATIYVSHDGECRWIF